MRLKLLSSLEKCFLDESIDEKKEYISGTCLKNELFHFEAAFQLAPEEGFKDFYYLTVESPIAEKIRVSRIEVVPVQYAGGGDEHYLRTEPGLYPDVMQPLEANGRIAVTNNLKSLMVEVDTHGIEKAGEYPVKLMFKKDNSEETKSAVFNLKIIDAVLPKQELIFTQWFYCDCLKQYYNVDTFSDEHFRIIENFAKTAVKYGINMLLTPVFTPPLDTYVGGERETTQLVGIKLDNGVYSFDFSLLGRWVEMCNRIGIEYFEIPHFFTQWGAKAAPKITATVDGEYKKLFGWETEATSREYSDFLSAFIPALLDYMKSLDGADKRCRFHISDEPSDVHLESYLAAKGLVAPLLKGYKIMDALSDYRFYSSGAVDNPIPSIAHIEPFAENNVPDLWGYYCVAENVKVSNRFMSMPSYRNRIIGLQLYKYNIAGFLHWGYNFYNNQFSYAPVNPFMNTDGEYFAPGGDTFSVYPGPDGAPWESVRLLVFYDAIQDISALKLCEKLYGREYVMRIIEDGIEPITFANYPHSDEYLLGVREKINSAIANHK